MFHKLHIQMTFFCSFITSSILIALTLLCFNFAKNSLVKNNYASFLKELNILITQLQSQDSISHQWLRQLQEDNHLLISLYDNGNPLYYQSLNENSHQALIYEAISTAQNNYELDIFQSSSSLLPTHEEFTATDSHNYSYYISAGKIPKSNGLLSFIVLYDLSGQQQQLAVLGWGIILADVTALLLLSLFSWFFTGRMLKPLESNQKQQIQFISSASHELRSPLAVMLSGLEAVEKAESDIDRHHFARLVREEGTRMQHLISDMLLLAGSDTKSFCLHLDIYQPDGILLNVYEKYEFLAQDKKISLTLSLPDEILPDLNCDFERINQVLAILMDNALSYTPSGGNIHLSLSYRKITPSGSGRIRFSIADTGTGVPDSEKKRIFERFYRYEASHTDKEHFGLGLCIARELIHAHKGKLWIKDTPGGGATFIVELSTNSINS